MLSAPAVIAQGKPFAGTTINASCFQTTFFEYLKNYFPQFEEKTGIKVNFTMQAFPVYNQRTDLELSTKGSALDVVNATFIYTGRWIGAGWLTNLDTFTKDPKIHAGRLGAGGFRGRHAIGDAERQGRDLRLLLGRRRHDPGARRATT